MYVLEIQYKQIRTHWTDMNIYKQWAAKLIHILYIRSLNVIHLKFMYFLWNKHTDSSTGLHLYHVKYCTVRRGALHGAAAAAANTAAPCKITQRSTVSWELLLHSPLVVWTGSFPRCWQPWCSRQTLKSHSGASGLDINLFHFNSPV